MVIAKSAYVHDLLRRMLHTDAFRREYLALARGAFSDDAGTVDLPIGRDGAAPTKRAVTPDGSRRARSTRFWSAFPRARAARPPRSRGARTRSAYTWRPSATALWRRSLRLAGRHALPTGAPLGVSFAPPPRHRGNAGAHRSAAGRYRKKDGGAPPPVNTPPPPAVLPAAGAVYL